MDTTTAPTAAEIAASVEAGFASLTGRARRAAEIIRAGGVFSEQLERNWKGVQQFRTRLLDASGVVVPGFGFRARHTCERAGILRRVSTWRTSAWETRLGWRLADRSEEEIRIDRAHDMERDYV